ncbi:MAG TPA: hypothetical protein VL882_24530 [Vicinamibacterales bacterium]|jgi:hypothetical protein|nr:hypothetical protein [Vicinamibacterales bacterium]
MIEHNRASSNEATDKQPPTGTDDPGLRRMMTWVAVALIATLALGFLVVEITLRWFGQRS